MAKPIVTVVVPCFNEQDNITQLIERIDTTFTKLALAYELLVVDDNSSDATPQLVSTAQARFPEVRLLTKPAGAPKGRGHSIMFGVQEATAEVVVCIDADLQYPPEAIPALLQKMQQGADIVIGDRVQKQTTAARKLYSSIFRKCFAEWLHGVQFDVLSGLKAFRKEIFHRITVHPTAWTFELELVIKAQHAGYKIDSVPIAFDRRRKGPSKMKVGTATWEIGRSALRLKSKEPEPIPFSKAMKAKEGEGFHYVGKKFVTHNLLHARETALFRLARNQRIFLIALGLLFGLWLFLNWHMALVVLMAILTVIYFADLLFNFFLIYSSFSTPPEVSVSDEEMAAVPEENWPTYTIFCPLYKEPEVIPQFVTAMKEMEYPADKLQIMLLLEENDADTIKKAESFNLPANFEVVIVPHSFPKTKPKACNFGLTKAKGEYCVIYDAEDVPDKDQLKKAVLAFQKVGKKAVCIQAKLNFYNPHQNMLTRAFTAEYSLWFDLVLTGLQATNTPIPLGGTSNHFKTAKLRELNGWDAFNVTEDCDLGIRLSKRGYKTAVLDSTTLEEANSSLMNWFQQRSRWIKGYMQTYLVHMRHPAQFIKKWNDPHVITFQLVVGGKIMSMFINPLMWFITLSYFVFRPFVGEFIESFFPGPVLYMGVFSFVFGNFLYLYYYMIGCAKREHYDLIKYVYLVPFYWLAMSVAAWLAFYDLLVRPHYWAKTKHGLHMKSQKAMKQAREKVGRSLVSQAFAIE